MKSEEIKPFKGVTAREYYDMTSELDQAAWEFIPEDSVFGFAESYSRIENAELKTKYDKLHDLNQKASDGIYNTNVALRKLQVKYEALERKLDQEQDRFNSLVKSLEGLWEDDESYRFDYVNDAVTSFRSDLKAILNDHK